MRPRPWIILALVGAVMGALFAGVSTYDYVQHLDRQVHTVHCSFIPGGGAHLGASGCQAAMMSPYSSVFRSQIWGGIPISLPALAVFAFLAFFCAELMLSRRDDDRRATGFLAVATALPALASIVMAYISITEVHAVCKLCVGIYTASAIALLGGIVAWATSGSIAPRLVAPPPMPRGDDPAWVTGAEPPPAPAPVPVAATTRAPVSGRYLAAAFGVGVLFVVVPVAVYAATAPDHSKFVGTCDGLASTEDTYGVMVRMHGGGDSAVPAIEIVDPLCPSCRAFEQRLDASGMAGRLRRDAVMFPLDSTCNWMVDEPLHPGACAISEAVLCAGDDADDVLAWAFTEQDAIKKAAAADPEAAAWMARQRFPELASCIGSAAARAKLNKSLRWAVNNGVQVMTPQLYVDGVKLCDEDLDLGLEYALAVMLDRHASGTLVATTTSTPATHKLEPTEEEARVLAAPTATAKPREEPTAAKPAPAGDEPAAAEPPAAPPAAPPPAAEEPPAPAAEEPPAPAAEEPPAEEPVAKPSDDPPPAPPADEGGTP